MKKRAKKKKQAQSVGVKLVGLSPATHEWVAAEAKRHGVSMRLYLEMAIDFVKVTAPKFNQGFEETSES